MSYAPALAVDLGGTFLRSAIVSPTGELGDRTRMRLRTVFDGDDVERVWDTIVDRLGALSDDARRRLSDDAPLMIAFPGPVTAASDIVCAPTLTGSEPVPPGLCARIADRAKRSVRIMNDLSAAARHFERTTDSNRFAVIAVSSGIGSRVVVRGHADTEPAYSGEIGHLVVDRTQAALACDCGGRGHLGSIASGRGIERAARRAAELDSNGFAASAACVTFGATAATLNNEAHVVPAIVAGDPWTLGVVERSVDALAGVLFQTIVAAGLEKVYVIGGFATALGERYAAMLEAAIRSRSDSTTTALAEGPFVRVSDPAEEACLRGAAAAA